MDSKSPVKQAWGEPARVASPTPTKSEASTDGPQGNDLVVTLINDAYTILEIGCSKESIPSVTLGAGRDSLPATEVLRLVMDAIKSADLESGPESLNVSSASTERVTPTRGARRASASTTQATQSMARASFLNSFKEKAQALTSDVVSKSETGIAALRNKSSALSQKTASPRRKLTQHFESVVQAATATQAGLSRGWTSLRASMHLGVLKRLNSSLSSPNDRCIAILRDLQNAPGTTDAVIDDLEYVIRTIVNGTSFRPSITSSQRGSIDELADEKLVTEWLRSDFNVEDPNNSGISDEGSETMSRRTSTGFLTVVDLTLPADNGWASKPASDYELVNPTLELSIDERDSLQRVLEGVDDWDFDVFEVDRLSKGNPLAAVAYAIYERADIRNVAGIPVPTLTRFLSQIESGYLAKNPYHNNIHAADVVQTTFVVLKSGGMLKHLNGLQLLSMVTAAVIHDYKHPGTSNKFQQEASTYRAITYNDTSVLENYHLSTAFHVLRRPETNVFVALAETDRKAVRALIIELVLATDMAHHFDLVGALRANLQLQSEEQAKPAIGENINLYLKLCLKVGDISNCAKREALYMNWAERVMSEFYMQGDQEKELELDVSAFMDREKPDMPKCQIGFINFIVLPFYEIVANFLDNWEPHVQQIKANRDIWIQPDPPQFTPAVSSSQGEEGVAATPGNDEEAGKDTAPADEQVEEDKPSPAPAQSHHNHNNNRNNKKKKNNKKKRRR